MPEDDDADKNIFIVQTVPPPSGDHDAYSAPTKVGAMASSIMEEMVHRALRESAEQSKFGTEPPPTVRPAIVSDADNAESSLASPPQVEQEDPLASDEDAGPPSIAPDLVVDVDFPTVAVAPSVAPSSAPVVSAPQRRPIGIYIAASFVVGGTGYFLLRLLHIVH